MRRIVGRRAFGTRITELHGSAQQYGERSAVTRLLWEIRNREQSRLNPAEIARQPPKTVLDKVPRDSYVEIVLPFSSDEALRQEYISPFGHVRIGRLLEDLDAFAGNIAFLHCDDNDPSTRLPTIVTASVDKLDLLPKSIDPSKDLRLCGGVTSVGSSSMEIRIDAFQEGAEPSKKKKKENSTQGQDELILTTYFTMVARDPVTGKAHTVNRLVPQTEQEKRRQLEGDRNKEERLAAKASSLTARLPTQEELEMIHSFFITDNAAAPKKNAENTSSPSTSMITTSVPMSETHQRSMIFCSHQQRNIHNKIFGGYLMRKAFELAFSTAYLFAGRRPYFSALGDITFQHAVEIGALLDLRAAVVYTEGNDIQVHVTARVHQPEKKTVIKTNDFAFSFDLYNEDDNMSEQKCYKRVKPQSYAEAMSYIEGRRNLHRHRKKYD